MKDFVKWLFTRWYYYVINLILISLSQEISLYDLAENPGYFMGYVSAQFIFMGLFIGTYYLAFQRGYKKGKSEK